MTLKRDLFTEYQIEEAIGDGNCLLNSFGLAYFTKEVLDEVEANLADEGLNPDDEFKPLIEKVARKLGVQAKWSVVKPLLLGYRQSHPREFQKGIAPILREYVIEEIEKEQDPVYEAYLEENLLTVYDRHAAYGVSDDVIFTNHNFILQKLNQIRQLKTSQDNKKAQFLAWWRAEGFKKFLAELKKDGVHLGDDILYKLSKCFRVIPAVKHRGSAVPTELFSSNGELSLPGLTYEQAEELAHRGVAQGKSDLTRDKFSERTVLQWRKRTEEQVDEVLSAVPNVDGVRAYIALKKPAAGAEIPSSWTSKENEKLLQQLTLRGVVSKDSKSGKDVFATDNTNKVSLDTTMRRIEAVPGKDQIIANRKKTYHEKMPMVVLANDRTAHWNNVKVKKGPVVVAASEPVVTKTKSTVTTAATSPMTTVVRPASSPKPTITTVATTNNPTIESKWASFVISTQKPEKNPADEKNVSYSVASALCLMGKPSSSEKDVKVSKAKQVELDRELAEVLQEQENARGVIARRT